jgi:heme/copper-type cytochrome/quinol oxidase subunit 3
MIFGKINEVDYGYLVYLSSYVSNLLVIILITLLIGLVVVGNSGLGVMSSWIDSKIGGLVYWLVFFSLSLISMAALSTGLGFICFSLVGWIGIWCYGLSWLNDLWLETFCKMTYLEMKMILSAMKWLIFSELMLFVGCFWALINFRLVTVGLYFLSYFPLFSFNALSIPFSNLMILLYSTLPCQSMLLFIKVGLLDFSLDGIGQTILCGLLFITLQSMEFLFSLYTISDLIVGSVFYFTTSIHGLHVIIGSIGWLIIILNGIESYDLTTSSSSESSKLTSSFSSPSFFLSIALSPFLWSYYWHFVDLIWLILFMLLVL